MTQIADLLQMRRFTSGRAAFAAKLVRDLARARKEEDIEEDSQEVIDSAQTALGKRREWAKGLAEASGARGGGKALELDNRLDRLVSAIYNNAHGFVRSLEPDAPEAKQANELLSNLFPRGVADITNKAFEDEAAAVQLLLKDLRGRFAPHSRALGLTALVTQLAQVHDAFSSALGQTAPTRVSHDEVTATENATQELLAGLIVSISAKHRGTDPTVVARRTELLAPILDQDERILDSLRRRRPVSDVNPETGQEVDDPPPEQ
jgi:hypothetical protein